MKMTALILGALWLSLCSVPAGATVKVVATVPGLAAIAKEIGGEHVRVDSLCDPAQDPHYVDARPDYVVLLNRADLLLVNGVELEVGWLPSLLVSARNPRIQPGSKGYFDASLHVELKEKPAGKVDRSMGDIHPGGNPHFLYDPRSVASVAAAFQKLLSEQDPPHSSEYQANARRFLSGLMELSREQSARFASLPEAKRNIVAYHRSLVYLLDWLGLREIATVEPKPGISPSPGHTAEVLGIMKEMGVYVLVQESFYGTSTSKSLVEITGGRLVVIPGGVDVDAGQSYLDFLKGIADDLYAAVSI